MIRAFAIARFDVDARLIILGEGSLRNELESLVNQLNIEHAVSMPGWIDNPYSFMNRADLFVLSSNHEGFPRALNEALICGCPVVSTDCPSGPSEIFENGRWGRLVPVGDEMALAQAMIATLNEVPDREALRDRGMSFDSDKLIGQYERLFRETISEYRKNQSA